MYTPTQLSAIKLFGKKDLTFGCLVNWKEDSIDDIQHIINYPNDNEDFKVSFNGNYVRYPSLKDFEILGHEPHLEDVFRVAEENGWEISVSRGIKIWWLGYSEMNPSKKIKYNPSLPLLEQDESTLKELIKLFEK